MPFFGYIDIGFRVIYVCMRNMARSSLGSFIEEKYGWTGWKLEMGILSSSGIISLFP